MTIKNKLFIVLLIFSTFCLAKSNLPRSREAVFIEVTSPGVVMIKATGIGIDKKNRKPKSKNLDKSANLDARRTAVWFVLSGNTDPILYNEESQKKFKNIENDFFNKNNINNYIAWESEYYESRVKIDSGKKLKVKKTYKINTGLIEKYLVEKGIISQKTEIMQKIGLPFIMVIPETKGDISAIELLQTDINQKKGAEVIEAYLTAKSFDVIVPGQQKVIQDLSSTQFLLAGEESDFSYMLALSIGSDVYITYSIDIFERKVGSTTVKKVSVGCRAFETTTGKLLGTETGYSNERNTSDAVLIEEAMKDAVEKVLSRIIKYWEKDLRQGVQYKLIVKVSQDFSTDEAEDIIFAIADIIPKISKSYKENIVADFTYDTTIWCDVDQIKSSSDIYRYFKKNYENDGEIKRISLNRKLILLEVIYE